MLGNVASSPLPGLVQTDAPCGSVLWLLASQASRSASALLDGPERGWPCLLAGRVEAQRLIRAPGRAGKDRRLGDTRRRRRALGAMVAHAAGAVGEVEDRQPRGRAVSAHAHGGRPVTLQD